MIDLSLSKQLLSLVHTADQPIQASVNNVGAAQAILSPSQNPHQAVVQEQARVAQALPAMPSEPQPAVENVHLAEDVNLEVCSHFI